ncbi:MAG: hypothetical protein AAFY88_31330, partial [Acidobacteriota bacterium]
GRRAAGDIARELGMGRYQAQFTLYYLTQYDLIEATGKAGKESPRSQPMAASGTGAGQPPAPMTPTPQPAAPGPAAPRPAGPGTPAPGPAPAAAPKPAAAPRPAQDDLIPFLDDSSPSLGAGPRTATPTADDDLLLSNESSRGGAVNAEIFMPPDDLDESQVGRGPGQSTSAKVLDVAAIVLAAVLVVVFAATLAGRPVTTLLPFPWQDNARNTAEKKVRDALFQRIDRAARTYFLLEAHYPDTLDELVTVGLLDAGDLRGPAGHPLSYTTDGVSYRISLLKDGVAIEGLGTTEAITGDFLVDPQFLSEAAQAEAPLVLLD